MPGSRRLLDPLLLRRLYDDAAVFPPGDLPVADAVAAHLDHRASEHAALVGPLVLAPEHLGEAAAALAADPGAGIEVALTLSSPELAADALETARTIPGLGVCAVESALPAGAGVDALVLLEPAAELVEIFVEVPRDERRPTVVAALAELGWAAKLRTGGVRAEAYPGEEELAEALVLLASAAVPVKATAGLHHAVRHTAEGTGFEEHGFLNLLLAADAARLHATVAEVAGLLAARDRTRVAREVREASVRVRESFRSIGTCSIAEPLTELAALRLVPASVVQDLR
ncbi:hypothetical protein JK386_02005 [Nocardioides sp. zg-536]|uniref:Uncharacterized protein n=1 Tax=Nocardioides faecalis TaxID=2803858 RepID=A0A939BWS5_9ACTN|nr:hypothetical protein [Nocardioides faecalis]MBM9458668.1 hypothetical protein [Nocardioides faecalis]MBS4753002.1 hypothetical protein [Nocardioides faecalis]QVI58660.1 hypothetical protein KG111_17095 [Nocardioides faecalis]